MRNCSKCGSYAINHHLHGRDGSDPDLCDVCYWRGRAGVDAETVKKAARYDWLRHGALDALAKANWGAGDVYEGEQFDAAIDAVIAAQAKEGGA